MHFHPYASRSQFAKTHFIKDPRSGRQRYAAHVPFWSDEDDCDDVICPYSGKKNSCVALCEIHLAIPCVDGRIRSASSSIKWYEIITQCHLPLADRARLPKHYTIVPEAVTNFECLTLFASMAETRLIKTTAIKADPEFEELQHCYAGSEIFGRRFAKFLDKFLSDLGTEKPIITDDSKKKKTKT